MTLAASTSTDKSLKGFDEIEEHSNRLLELLKGTRSNYAELEYDFEECYKALLEKLDWENPEGGDYPFDLSKPLPLIKRGKRQRVPFEFFINNDLKYLQEEFPTMTYTTQLPDKAAKYDLPALKTWFQTYGVLLKLLMIDMRYGVSHIGDNNICSHFLSGDTLLDFAIDKDVHQKSSYSEASRGSSTWI
ncbi:hypothetical protein Tco_0969376 [Tanacetum coccineum]